jgi:membrane-associated phospholipid phosphatase
MKTGPRWWCRAEGRLGGVARLAGPETSIGPGPSVVRHPADRPWPRPSGVRRDLALAGALVLLTSALVWWPAVDRLDLTVRDWADSHRPSWIWLLAQSFDRLGESIPLIALTVLLGFAFSWRSRTLQPLLLTAAAPIVNSSLIVALKVWTHRGAPHGGGVRLFADSGHTEYPSGHVANAVVYYSVLALLLSPFLPTALHKSLRWVPGPLTLIGTTWLAYHWLTDGIAGLLLGAIAVRLLQRISRWDLSLPHPPAL